MDNLNEKNETHAGMLSIDELRAFAGNENKSDAELMELAIFLKEFSLILYAAYIKSSTDQ